MRLILFHPGAASIDCGECQKFVFDTDTGEKATHKSGPDRIELPMIRRPDNPPPCRQCPKKSPEHAKEIELSKRNLYAFSHYEESRGVGLSDCERNDPIVRRNHALLNRITARFERRAEAKALVDELLARLSVK